MTYQHITHTLKPEELAKRKAEIDAMTLEELAGHHRFDPSGSRYVQREIYDYFSDRFEALGGMTPELSKRIGWRRNG